MSNYLLDSSRGPVSVDPHEYWLRERKIFIEGEITPSLTNDVIRQIMYLGKDSTDKGITIFVNSPGGDVTAGLSVFDCISKTKSPITTVCTGLAASMGAIIFLSGDPDKRFLLESSRLMIHDPAYGGNHSVANLKPHEIQSELDELNKCRDKLAHIIADRTGQPLSKILEVTKKDSFFNLDEAVEFGLATGGVPYDIFF